MYARIIKVWKRSKVIINKVVLTNKKNKYVNLKKEEDLEKE